MTSRRRAAKACKDTAARVLPYYIQEILPHVLRGERVLISAHGNSLRALVMVLENLAPDEIVKRELATGVPLIYRLNARYSTVASKVDPLRRLSRRGLVPLPSPASRACA